MALGQWAADPLMAIVTGFVPSIALGVIVPILAKVMTWYRHPATKARWILNPHLFLFLIKLI